MRGRLVGIVILLTLAACSQGPPYAFRLMVPPNEAAFLPYWFWEEVELFDRFTECEQARKSRVAAAREFLAGKPLKKGYVFTPEDEGREVGKPHVLPSGKRGAFLLGEGEKRAGKRLNEDGYVLYPSAEERRERERLLRARCVPLR